MNDLFGNPDRFVEYAGIFLDPEYKTRLIDRLSTVIPVGWKIYCDHCTLCHFRDNPKPTEVLQYINANIGQKVLLHADELGVSMDAIAIKVSGNFMSARTINRITVAVPPGGKPVNSNYIRKWAPYDLGFDLVGTVDLRPRTNG